MIQLLFCFFFSLFTSPFFFFSLSLSTQLIEVTLINLIFINKVIYHFPPFFLSFLISIAFLYFSLSFANLLLSSYFRFLKESFRKVKEKKEKTIENKNTQNKLFRNKPNISTKFLLFHLPIIIVSITFLISITV